MKCLVKTCKNNSLLMTVELCYPCSQLVEQGNDFVPDWDTLQPYIDRIAELELKIVMLDEACANCGVKTSDGYALYCVKCSEPLREWLDLTDEELSDTYVDGVLAERKRIVDLLMIQHEAAKGSHNYWQVAANLIKAESGETT